jgi:6-phosphogluconolactonase
MTKTYAYVGSLTQGTAAAEAPPGISVFAFDDEAGELDLLQQIGGIDNPSWVIPDPTHGRLYAVTERTDWNEGTVTAYAIEAATGRLSYINKQPTLGSCTCHIGLSADGRYLAAANYATLPPGSPPDRSLALFARTGEGHLASALSSARHEGRGQDPARQERSHAHCALFTPDSLQLFVADLGLDRLIAYTVGADGQLVSTPEHDVVFESGRGPRHAAFHPGYRAMFAVHELRPSITALSFDETTARPIETIDLDYPEQVYPSAILPSPDGRHLYVAVRVVGEIIGFSIGLDFRLAEIGRWPCGGTWPRDARLSPSGRWLLVANQHDDAITIFRRDAVSGELHEVGITRCSTPMCVAFLEQ